MALLADDDLGQVMDLSHLRLPIFVFLGARLLRLQAPEVILMAVNEGDHVGVLFDGPRFAQVGELGPLVVALLDGAAELGQGQHRHVQFLGQRLEALGDVGDFLDPVVAGAAGGRAQELEVVDDDEAELMLALEAAGTGAQLAHRKGRGVVDEKGNLGKFLICLDHFLEIGVGQVALADAVGTDPRGFRQNPCGQLLGGHFQGKEADHGAVHQLALTLIVGFPFSGFCRVVGNVGGQRGLAHGGPARQDHQVGALQAAQQLVEIAEAGRRADKLAVPLVGRLGDLDGAGQNVGKGTEPAFVFAGGRQIEEVLLGGLDLLGAVGFQVRIRRHVAHFKGKLDQPAPEMKVEDGAPVIRGVDHRHRRGRQPPEILGTAGVGQGFVGLEDVLEGGPIGDLMAFDQGAAGGEDTAVDGFVEMFGKKKFGHPAIGVVVDQDGAEQGLFGLEIMGLVGRLEGAVAFPKRGDF